MKATRESRTGTYLLVYLALMVLLGATVGVTFLELGRLQLPASLGIAVVKAGLVALYFMHLRRASGLARLFAGAGTLWLVILLGLTLAEVLTRGGATGSG